MNEQATLQWDEQSKIVAACVEQFRCADPATRSNLRGFLQHVPSEYQLTALSELVRLDMQDNWQRGKPTRIEEYLQTYPELQQSENTVLELCREEFDRRQASGESPSVDEYRKLHPAFTSRSTRSVNQAQTATAEMPFAEAKLEAAPDHIDKYKILRELGTGSFGSVYEALDEVIQRRVAIKLQHRRAGQDKISDDMLMLNEARSVARLDHPGIVRLIDWGLSENDQGYLVYELVSGVTLEERIRRADFSTEQAVEWVAQCAEALACAHRNDIYHRDIKPANILIDGAGRAKIVDFGMARRDNTFFIDEAGHFVGTAAYFSPEQAEKKAHWASAQTDIFSLGIVLYELLCGWRPFSSTRQDELMDQIKHRTPAAPRSIKPDIPEGVEEACFKALAKDPSQRFRTGDDMAKALREAMQPDVVAAPAAGIKPVQWIASLIAVAAVCVLAATMISKPTAPVEPPSFNYMKLSLRRGDKFMPAITNEQLPLTGDDQLSVEAPLDHPAYGYLFSYEMNGKSSLLYPAREMLAGHVATDRIRQRLPPGALPNREGAVLIVALASQKPLSAADVDALLAEPFAVRISAADAAKSDYRVTIAEPAPKDSDGTVLRGSATHASLEEKLDGDAAFNAFKAKLKGKADAYHGVILPYRPTTSETTGEERPNEL